MLASMTETLLRDRPNTYCLTKAISEEYLFKHATDLPLGIFRPSIIGASWQEPAPVSYLLLVGCYNFRLLVVSSTLQCCS